MPTEVDKLKPGASEAQKNAAISDCIAYHVRQGMSQDEATGKCYGMARQNMGEENPNANKGI